MTLVTPVGEPSSSWRQWATAALDLLFPPLCPICHCRLGEGRRDPLCGSCWERLPRLFPPFCVCCGRPFWTFDGRAADAAGPVEGGGSSDVPPLPGRSDAAGAGLCGACARQRPRFSYARAAALYRDTAREALHALKFGGKATLARPLGDLLAETGEVVVPRRTVDCLVPVPLHPARQAERGFNQSSLLARRLSRRWGIPVAEGLLRRVRVTRSQTELSAAERAANVRGAFAVRRPSAVAGLHVLLIDDIFTTGATVSECCRVLLDAGARAAGVFTVARVG